MDHPNDNAKDSRSEGPVQSTESDAGLRAKGNYKSHKSKKNSKL